MWLIKYWRRLKKITQIKLYALLFIVSAVTSCDKINPDEAVPTYIYIESVEVVENPELQGREGSLDNDIKDVWISAGGSIVGAFELPAMVPIIGEGEIEVFIAAGIKKNGQTGDREIYPFWTNYVTTINAIPGKIDTLKPQVMYRSNTKFVWKENFETAAISLDSTLRSQMDSVGRTNDPAEILEPLWAGIVEMQETGLFEVQTKESYELPGFGAQVYLEVSFKGNFGVQFGFISETSGYRSQVPIFVASETDEWVKIYISLREDLGPEPAIAMQRIFIGAYNQSPDIVPKFYLDNLKLIQFE